MLGHGALKMMVLFFDMERVRQPERPEVVAVSDLDRTSDSAGDSVTVLDRTAE